MTGRGKRNLFANIIGLVFMFVFFSKAISTKVAYDIIGMLTNFFPFIIAGIIMLVLNINERKWGSIIYATVFIVIFYLSYK